MTHLSRHPLGTWRGATLAKASLMSLGLWAVAALPAQGHGARVNYQVIPSIEVQAQFDNGDPMANAQVAIFAPDRPETPWQTGLTDEVGNFRFSPDPDQAGDWEVQVRQAGHGSMTTIAVGSGGAIAENTSAEGAVLANSIASATQARPSPAQALLMTGLGLWGLLGTGLYFSRKPRAAESAAPEPPIPI